VKPAIVEDLIMEFDEAPADPGPTLARLREVSRQSRTRWCDHGRHRQAVPLDGLTAPCPDVLPLAPD